MQQVQIHIMTKPIKSLLLLLLLFLFFSFFLFFSSTINQLLTLKP
jgi:hypothetical protein